MKRIQVVIRGVTPLICNKFTDAAAAKATSGSGTSVIGDKGTPRDQAEQKLYIGLNGEPMIPAPNLFRCIIDAGKFHKNGRSKVTTQKSSLIPAAIGLGDQVEIKLEHEQPWEVDTRAVRIPATGGRILAHRPMFHDWALTFYIDLDESVMSPGVIRAILDDAGSKIGLGDFRPDCKGMFGKFRVDLWEVEDL